MSRPRIRSIKPEMWADEAIGCVSVHARLLFVGLITMADDEGRLRALPAAIIGHVFPYDDVSLRRLKYWITELTDVDLIRVYEDAQIPYIWLPKWRYHQKINRPQPSRLPPPPFTEGSVNGHGGVSEQARSAA